MTSLVLLLVFPPTAALSTEEGQGSSEAGNETLPTSEEVET